MHVTINRDCATVYHVSFFALQTKTYKRQHTLSNSSLVYGMLCKLQHPFTTVVAGPTGCGKSAWVLRLVDNAGEMIEPPSQDILLLWEFQTIFNNYPQVTFHEGLPELGDEVFDGIQPTVMIVGELMAETNQSVANISSLRTCLTNTVYRNDKSQCTLLGVIQKYR